VPTTVALTYHFALFFVLPRQAQGFFQLPVLGAELVYGGLEGGDFVSKALNFQRQRNFV